MRFSHSQAFYLEITHAERFGRWHFGADTISHQLSHSRNNEAQWVGGKSAGRERQISAKAATRFAGRMEAFSRCRWEPCRCTRRDSDGEASQPCEVLKGARSSCGKRKGGRRPTLCINTKCFLKATSVKRGATSVACDLACRSRGERCVGRGGRVDAVCMFTPDSAGPKRLWVARKDSEHICTQACKFRLGLQRWAPIWR